MKKSFVYLTRLLLAIIITFLSGCSAKFEPEGGPYVDLIWDTYCLYVSFQDRAGNDLVAPLGDEKWKKSNDNSDWAGTINPEKYYYDVKLPNPGWTRPETGLPDDQRRHNLKMQQFDDIFVEEGNEYWYFDLCTSCMAEAGIQDSIIYMISCPTIFGSQDNLTREIVAWWDKDPGVSNHSKDRKTGNLYPECTKVTFDGKDVSVKKVKQSDDDRAYYIYLIDIVLDR